MKNERNRDTLKAALAQLPHYQAPDALWQQVHARLTGTPARDELRDASPLFRAPDAAWDKITDELGYHETEHNREHLKSAIDRLPVYQAPEHLWLGLRSTLDRGVARVRKLQALTPLYQRVAAIAAVLLLFGGAWWMNASYRQMPQTDSERGITQEIQLDEVEILYSEEAINAEWGPETITLEAGTERLDPALNLNPEPDDLHPPTSLPEAWLRSTDPNMQALIAEWNELTAAQQHLREAIGDYNDDPRWVLRMAQIERSRAQLAKAMLKAQ